MRPILDPHSRKHTGKSTNKRASLSSAFTRPSPLALSRDLHLFGIMLQAALPLKDALENLSRTSTNQTLQSTYAHMLAQMRSGASLQVAIAPFAHVFSPLGVALIQAGAESGNLPQILSALSSYFAQIAKTRASFLKALLYPIFVCVSIVIAFVVIAMFVIPNFAELFASFDVELPFSTRSLLAISWAMNELWWVWVGLLGVLALVLLLAQKSQILNENLKRMGFGIILRAPLVGKLLVYRDLWGYFLGFSYLYNAHIEFDKALPIALLSLQIPLVQKSIVSVSDRISKGETLDRAFGACGYIDSSLRSFLATAQSSGELGEILGLCANYCQSMYEQQISRMLALIEPLSTIAIALVVGWLAFGIFLPIWELGSINL